MLKLTTQYDFHELFLNSNMAFFIGYINNAVKKKQLPIYFDSHMRIVEQIINIIPKWVHDCGTYKYKNGRFVYILCFFSGKNTKENRLSTLICVICRLPVT